MASSARRKFSVKHPVVVDVGCSCRRTKLSSLFSTNSPKPKPNPHAPPKHHHPLSSYYPFSPSTNTTNLSTTSRNLSSYSTSSYEYSSSPSWTTTKNIPHVSKSAKSAGRVVKESVAVVKESEDPFHDFRDSMLQMILEKEIYAWDDLRELLHRFLSLNSLHHHDAILRAFTEIWNDVLSTAGGTTTAATAATARRGVPRRNKQHHHQHMTRDPTRYGYVA